MERRKRWFLGHLFLFFSKISGRYESQLVPIPPYLRGWSFPDSPTFAFSIHGKWVLVNIRPKRPPSTNASEVPLKIDNSIADSH